MKVSSARQRWRVFVQLRLPRHRESHGGRHGEHHGDDDGEAPRRLLCSSLLRGGEHYSLKADAAVRDDPGSAIVIEPD